MRSRMLWLGLTVGCAVLLGCGQAGSKEGAMEPMTPEALEAAWMQAAEPGVHHAHLAALAGSWKQEVKWWMDPSGEPHVSQGTTQRRMIMDGRYLQEDVEGSMMEAPFRGLGIAGFDNMKQKYVSVWIDSMSSAIMTSEGTCDGSGKTITYLGSYLDPMTGKNKTVRSVVRIVDADRHIFEMHDKGPDGKEFKTLEITYTRM